MDASINLEEEEGGKGEEEKQGVPKTKKNFQKKLFKVEARVPTKEEKLSTLGPRGKKRLATGTIMSGLKEIKYFKDVPRKSGLARAHRELRVEGYGLFPKEFTNSGLWKASSANASNQQLGLLWHGTEDGETSIFSTLGQSKLSDLGKRRECPGLP